jgi:hypothetical protein
VSAQGSSSLSFEGDAHLWLRERGEQSSVGTWDARDLADVEEHPGTEVTFRPPSQEEGTESFRVEMTFHHLPNEDDSRAFHMSADLPLSRTQVELLRNYLNFALSMCGEEPTPC